MDPIEQARTSVWLKIRQAVIYNKGVLDYTVEDLIVIYLQKCFQQSQFTSWKLGFLFFVCVHQNRYLLYSGIAGRNK